MAKINGNYHSWANIEISIDGVSKEIVGDIVEINYEEKTEIKPRYGLGIMPKGYSKGNREFTGKISWNNEGYDAFFIDVVKAQGYSHIDELPPVNINVHYLDDTKQRVVTDVLEGVKFHSPKKSGKQGDTELTVETELFMMNIKWGQ